MFKKHIKKLADWTDEECLIAFCKEKDLEVLGQLYHRYMYLVFGVCMKYLKDREESKDAVIQIYEKLIDEIPKNQIENFKSWLYVVVKNFCLMKLRKETTERKNMEAFSHHYIMETENILHPIEEEATNGLEEKLKNCMEHLKQDQKRCVELFYYKKLCYQEIAESEKIPIVKVKSHIQNGKRNLKICIENSEKE